MTRCFRECAFTNKSATGMANALAFYIKPFFFFSNSALKDKL